jgi:AmiR/NasT family two-component response regulator
VSAELAAARQVIAELKTAVVTNRNIGAAIGILMARHSLTQQQAFDAMREQSQHSHRKLRDVAEEVLFTGRLAGSPTPPPMPAIAPQQRSG